MPLTDIPILSMLRDRMESSVLHEARRGFEHRRGAVSAVCTVAASPHRARDRIDSPRMSGPCDRVPRGIATQPRQVLRGATIRGEHGSPSAAKRNNLGAKRAACLSARDSASWRLCWRLTWKAEYAGGRVTRYIQTGSKVEEDTR